MCVMSFSLSIQILWCVYRYDCSQRSHNNMCSCVVCGVEFVLQWDHALTNNHSVVASMLLLHAKNWDPQNTQVQALAGSLMQHQLIHVVSYHFICPVAHHQKKLLFLFLLLFLFFFFGLGVTLLREPSLEPSLEQLLFEMGSGLNLDQEGLAFSHCWVGAALSLTLVLASTSYL